MGASKKMNKDELLKLAEALEALADSRESYEDLLGLFQELKKEASSNVDYDRVYEILNTVIATIGAPK